MCAYYASQNRNLELHVDGDWNDLPVISNHGPLVVDYLESNLRVMVSSCENYSRSLVLFLTVRLPADYSDNSSSIMTRFIASLNSQIQLAQERSVKDGHRIHPTVVRYVWAKERGEEGGWHFHVCLFLNRDSFFTLGSFDSAYLREREELSVSTTFGRRPAANLAGRITRALASALGMRDVDVSGLVDFSKNGEYCLEPKARHEFRRRFCTVFRRLSYFAKLATKQYGGNGHAYGCSRI